MNQQKLLPGMLGLTLAVLLSAACATPAATLVPPTPTLTRMPPTGKPSPMLPASATTPAGTSQFPTGLFDCVECQGMTERYSADGTLVVYLHGYKYITGKWYVESDVFHTGDGFCRDEDAMPASYKWHFDGEILTFQVIEDECSDRKNSLDGKPWRLSEKE